MKAAILGVSGYTGLFLLQLLSEHPQIEDIVPVSSSQYGQVVTSLTPGLANIVLEKVKSSEGKIVKIEEAAAMGVDVVFSALPHLVSAALCKKFYPQSVIIDLSADFRIDDAEIFNTAYGCLPPEENLLPEAVYGLSEWNKQKITGTDIIANPGCYPTASLLPLLPLAAEGLISGVPVINAISGISGAGKKLNANLLFCERLENSGSYAPGNLHRHSYEIAHKLSQAGFKNKLLFTPHFAPMRQGMAVTTAVKLTSPVKENEIFGLYSKYYSNSPFINLRTGSIPQTKDVWGSNRCDIGWHIENGYIILFSVIDNLIKGAAGQAIQNMNIRFGLKETAGLPLNSKI